MRKLTEAQARALRFAAGRGDAAFLSVAPVTQDRLLRRGLVWIDGGHVRILPKGRAALAEQEKGDA